jgi:WD40 repeat protein
MTIPNAIKKIDSAHSESIWAMQWSQGGIVSGSLDGTIKLWDVVENDISANFVSLKQKVAITSIAVVQDGSQAVVCFEDSQIRFYDTINKVEIGTLNPGLLEAWSICLSPGDDVLASGNNKGEVNIWSMQDGHEKIATLETNCKFILSNMFSGDGKLAAASSNGVVSLFDLTTQSIFHKIEAHALSIRSVVFSPSGDLIYTASDDRHVSVCDIRSGQIINSFSHAGMALCVDASPNQRHFVVGSADHCVTLWDLGMQRCVERFTTTHTDRVGSVTYDKSDVEGKRFVSGGDDGGIQLYG